MTFQEKCRLIEIARHDYVTFEAVFREYLGSGKSLNGAYNHFTLEDIEEHRKLSELKTELDAWETRHGGYKDCSPMRLKKYSISEKLEKLNNELSKPSRN